MTTDDGAGATRGAGADRPGAPAGAGRPAGAAAPGRPAVVAGADRPAVPAAAGRRRAILVVLALALAAFLAGVPEWLRAAGTTALEGEVPVAVTGTQAAPGVPAAALVLLAAGFAVGLAGRVGRWVVVGVVLLAGVLLSASALAVAADPGPVARTAVADVTGVETLAGEVGLTPWPWVAAGVGVVAVLAGVWLALTSRQWARPSDRHDVAPGQGAVRAAVVHDDDQAAWDALTRGDDPT